MSQTELIAWSHYYQIEPFGPDISRQRYYQLRCDVLNAPGRFEEYLQIEDLMPEEPMTAEEHMREFFGG